MAVCESSTPDLEETQKSETCTNCGKMKDVVRYCLACRENCCINCISIYHENHNILPSEHYIVQSMKRYSSQTCTDHDGKFCMYCIVCGQPCCMECIEEKHNGHSLSTLKYVSKQADSLHAKLVDILPKSKTEFRTFQSEYNSYVQSMNSAISGIISKFKSFRRSIDEAEKAMLQPLENEFDKFRQIYAEKEENIKEFDYLVALFECAKEEENHLIKAIFLSNCPILENLNVRTESFPEPALFKPASFDIAEINASSIREQMIGSIERSNGQQFMKSESGLAKDVSSILEVKSLRSFNTDCFCGRVVQTKSKDMKKWTVNQKSIYTLNGYERMTNLSIVDEFLVEEDILNVKEIISECSLMPPSDLIYTETKGENVYRIDISGNKSLVVNTSPVTPTGICYTKDKQLVLGLQDRGKTRSLMRMYSSTDLKPLDEIEKDDQGKSLFSSIRSILQNPLEDFIIHDDCDLLCVSKQVTLRWKIKEDFRYFCIDKFCNIIVSTDDDIRVFDGNGKYVKTLLTKFDFLTTPRSLSVDMEGLLWIGQYRSVKVLKYWN